MKLIFVTYKKRREAAEKKYAMAKTKHKKCKAVSLAEFNVKSSNNM